MMWLNSNYENTVIGRCMYACTSKGDQLEPFLVMPYVLQHWIFCILLKVMIGAASGHILLSHSYKT